MAETDPGSAGYDANQRLALVCVDHAERKAAVTQALQELGYRAYVAENPTDTNERMRKESYEVLVLDEEFQGARPHDNPLLKAVQAMPMATRRYIFVVLLGKEFKTFDNMTAFCQSVNVVVNVNDMAQIKTIIQRGAADNDQFFRVFRQVLQEAGRR
jgi:hypothetical protein